MNASSADNRQYRRHMVLDYASVIPVESGSHSSGFIVDVGLGGVALKSRGPLEVGREVKVLIGQGDEDPIEVHAHVKYCSFQDSGSIYTTGLQFAPVTHSERIVVAQYVNSAFQRSLEAVGA